MSLAPESEAARPGGSDFLDTVHFAFGDPGRELHGSARIALHPAEGTAWGTALLFRGPEPLVALGIEDASPAGEAWKDVTLGVVRCRVLEPLCAWQVDLDAPGGGFSLRFSTTAPAAELDPEADSPSAWAGGLAGYEHVCRVQGTVGLPGGQARVDCLGQRGHRFGSPDRRRVALVRGLGAWFSPTSAVAVDVMRPTRAAHHDAERIGAVLLGRPTPPSAPDADRAAPERPGCDPADARAVIIDEPRLSLTHDADGALLRAGLELWESERSEHARRLAGETVGAATLQAGGWRISSTFLHWHFEGAAGSGCSEELAPS